jgi:heptose-I-phosphate ethanolaminephosphotransferase
MTKRNTMLPHVFRSRPDEQFYLNNRAQNARQYDGDAGAFCQGWWADGAPRKFIVRTCWQLHINISTAIRQSLSVLLIVPAPDNVTDNQLPTYNSYDNAVLRQRSCMLA